MDNGFNQELNVMRIYSRLNSVAFRASEQLNVKVLANVVSHLDRPLIGLIFNLTFEMVLHVSNKFRITKTKKKLGK